MYRLLLRSCKLMGAFIIHPRLPFCQSHYQQQGPFAPQPLQPLPRYYWPVRHPLAFLPLPGVAGYRSDLLQRFLAGARRASPVCLMRPCHRAVADTPPKWFAASVSLQRAMLLSPSSEGFGLWGDYFSGLLCVVGSGNGAVGRRSSLAGALRFL